MLMQPRRQKYRRTFRAKIDMVASNGTKLSFGDYGIRAMEPSLISAKQIEAARKKITHYTKRSGKVWVRMFPYHPRTEKAAGVKMGGGKGSVSGFVSPIRAGRILFEIVGVSEDTAKEAFRLAGYKLPCKVKFVRKEDEF
jgi:large subunit ribosomal protein L16